MTASKIIAIYDQFKKDHIELAGMMNFDAISLKDIDEASLIGEFAVGQPWPLFPPVLVKPDCGHEDVIKCEVRVNAAWYKVQWCWDCLEPFAKEGLVIYPPEPRGGRRVK